MKQRIKYAIEHGIQNALQLFRLLPLQNRVNFISFSGHFPCPPLAKVFPECYPYLIKSIPVCK